LDNHYYINSNLGQPLLYKLKPWTTITIKTQTLDNH